MSESFELKLEIREDEGKGASRRLRHANKVPGIIYGGGKDPVMVMADHDEMLHHLEQESFYSHILDLKVGKGKDKAVLKDLQRHPYKRLIMHFDLLRVDAKTEIRMNVPLHFANEESAVGVKAGGIVMHNMTEIEISCLPKNLPEFIEVDTAELELGAAIHLEDLTLPKGVRITVLEQDGDHNLPVVSIHAPKAAPVEDDEDGAEPTEAGEE